MRTQLQFGLAAAALVASESTSHAQVCTLSIHNTSTGSSLQLAFSNAVSYVIANCQSTGANIILDAGVYDFRDSSTPTYSAGMNIINLNQVNMHSGATLSIVGTATGASGPFAPTPGTVMIMPTNANNGVSGRSSPNQNASNIVLENIAFEVGQTVDEVANPVTNATVPTGAGTATALYQTTQGSFASYTSEASNHVNGWLTLDLSVPTSSGTFAFSSPLALLNQNFYAGRYLKIFDNTTTGAPRLLEQYPTGTGSYIAATTSNTQVGWGAETDGKAIVFTCPTSPSLACTPGQTYTVVSTSAGPNWCDGSYSGSAGLPSAVPTLPCVVETGVGSSGVGSGSTTIIAPFQPDPTGHPNWWTIYVNQGGFPPNLVVSTSETLTWQQLAQEANNLVCVKSKPGWAGPYAFGGNSSHRTTPGAQNINFINDTWQTDAAGVFSGGSSTISITNSGIVMPPSIGAQSPCLSDSGGGPQIGQPGDPAISDITINGFTASNTGDDTIAIFHDTSDTGTQSSIRNVSINGAYGHAIRLSGPAGSTMPTVWIGDPASSSSSTLSPSSVNNWGTIGNSANITLATGNSGTNYDNCNYYDNTFYPNAVDPINTLTVIPNYICGVYYDLGSN